MRATLEVRQGQRVGSRFPIGARIVIGRDVGCDLQLFDEGLSRRHFLIEQSAESYRIEDLGSSNGTYINGHKISTARLTHGDLITAGSTQLQFLVGNEGSISSSGTRRPTPTRVSDLVELVDEPATSNAKIMRRVDVGTLRWFRPGEQEAQGQAQAARALSVLYSVGNLVSAETSLEGLCQSLTDEILEVISGDRAFIILRDAGTGELETFAASTKRESFSGRSKVSKTVVEDCMSRGISVLSADAMSDQRFKAGDSVMLQNIRSVMCVPVESNSQILGVIYVDNLSASNMFVEFDLELVTAIGKQAGVAIERARLVEDMQELFYGTIRTLVATLEAKDEYTHGHSERVTSYAVQIAIEMGLDQEIVDTIHLAGLLHDIGKVGISEKILNKPARLTDEEFAIIKTHPVIGADIVRNIKGTEEVASIVRGHHEHFNGGGYPDGLKGDEISLPTRILTVADSYDAMTSSRAYRRNLSTEEIVEEFKRCSGEQFDPEVAETFIKILLDGRLATIKEVYERGLDSHFSTYFQRFRQRNVSSGVHKALAQTKRRKMPTALRAESGKRRAKPSELDETKDVIKTTESSEKASSEPEAEPTSEP